MLQFTRVDDEFNGVRLDKGVDRTDSCLMLWKFSLLIVLKTAPVLDFLPNQLGFREREKKKLAYTKKERL